MKNKWHTWTLFYENGKYRWSYKYDTCIKCWTVESKHKWKWLCARCYDKKRKENPKRVFNLAKQNWRYYYKTRILMFLEKTEHKKKQAIRTPEYYKQYKKDWFQKNKRMMYLKARTKRLLKKWLNLMTYNINWKVINLPFESLERPSKAIPWEYDKRKQNMKDFLIIKNYYE